MAKKRGDRAVGKKRKSLEQGWCVDRAFPGKDQREMQSRLRALIHPPGERQGELNPFLYQRLRSDLTRADKSLCGETIAGTKGLVNLGRKKEKKRQPNDCKMKPEKLK